MNQNSHCALFVSVADEVRVYDSFALKHTQPGVKKPLSEQWVGDDFQQTTGLWVKKERLIDRTNDWYRESVVDPKTGNLIHLCEEALSTHRGHGSAKRKTDGMAS